MTSLITGCYTSGFYLQGQVYGVSLGSTMSYVIAVCAQLMLVPLDLQSSV